MPIHFANDQDDWDELPQEYKDHFMKAVVHGATGGQHPGKYQGPPVDNERPHDHEDPTESELAYARMREIGPPQGAPPPGPLPPQESVDQPPGAGGAKKQSSKPPSGTTPTAIGEQAVKPQEPEGNF